MDSEQAEKKSVRVTIFNQPYTLRASGDPKEVVELARSVDELMSSIASHTGTAEAGRVAVLACLHLADKLSIVERELKGLREQIEKKSERFSSLLDQVIEGSKE